MHDYMIEKIIAEKESFEKAIIILGQNILCERCPAGSMCEECKFNGYSCYEVIMKWAKEQ